ncbi:MAG TPA: glycosyl transferase family 36, partial [Rhodanobacteraceae bacterium]|nr:glycosyl transferase family 36 [Rhodanobacteraceae bacterium]
MLADAPIPRAPVNLLGRDGYSVMLDASGAGYSRWNGLAVSRWRAADRSPAGGYVYLRDKADGNLWSASPAPCGGAVRRWCDEAMVRFARRDGTLVTTLEVAVDPGHPVEVRGLGLRNDGPVAREVELTSYLELVLGSQQADNAHPAYSKMFVQTAVEQVVMEQGVLLAWRRKKDPSEPDVWAAHALVVDGDECGAREWETDRMRFIGRDGSLAVPAALRDARALSGTVGTVLDPVFSLRTSVAVAPGQTRRAAFVTAVAASRDEVLASIRGCLTPQACAGIFARARAAAPRTLQSTGIDAEAARAFQALAGALLGIDDSWRADAAAIAQAEGGAPVLWAKGISGDLPIVLLCLDDVAQAAIAKELLDAQRWWRAHQLPTDIVVVNAVPGAGGDAADAALKEIASAAGQGEKSQGSLFLLRGGELDERLRNGLRAAACIVLDARDGGLATQVARRASDDTSVMAMPRAKTPHVRGGQPASMPSSKELPFWNGLGGFTRDGREYVTVLRDGASTPAPWSHLVANPGFGFLATATGGGYAWAVNSQQNQITAWSNDATCDPPGEVFLLRDADDGTEWSATASPIRVGGAAYVARFGPGYARFDASVHGIQSELMQCVAAADPVKLSRLRLHNRSGRARRIDVAQMVAWMLGPIGGDPRANTQVEVDPARGAVFARNAWREEFTQAVAFIACAAKGAKPGGEAGPRSAVVASIEL